MDNNDRVVRELILAAAMTLSRCVAKAKSMELKMNIIFSLLVVGCLEACKSKEAHDPAEPLLYHCHHHHVKQNGKVRLSDGQDVRSGVEFAMVECSIVCGTGWGMRSFHVSCQVDITFFRLITTHIFKRYNKLNMSCAVAVIASYLICCVTGVLLTQ